MLCTPARTGATLPSPKQLRWELAQCQQLRLCSWLLHGVGLGGCDGTLHCDGQCGSSCCLMTCGLTAVVRIGQGCGWWLRVAHLSWVAVCSTTGTQPTSWIADVGMTHMTLSTGVAPVLVAACLVFAPCLQDLYMH